MHGQIIRLCRILSTDAGFARWFLSRYWLGSWSNGGMSAMNDAFESIKQGLLEAIEHAEGKPVKAILHKPASVDVKAVREKVGMPRADIPPIPK
jgi:hypothetical protein